MCDPCRPGPGEGELDLPRRSLSPGVVVRRAAGPAGQLRFWSELCARKAASSSQPGHGLLAGASGGRQGVRDERRAVCGCVHTRELACTSAR